MGTGEEAVGEGELQVREEGAVDDPIAEAASPIVSELALRPVDLVLPREPLYINGQPHSVNVDEERLTTALNVVAEDTCRRAFIPRQLVIDLHEGDSTLGYDEGIRPRIVAPEEDIPPLVSQYGEKGSSLHIMLPSGLADTRHTDLGLAELVARQANQDLLVALSQNARANHKLDPSLRLSALALGAVGGETTGVILSDTWDEVLGKGSVGALLGSVLVITGLIILDKIRGRAPNSSQWAIERSRGDKKIHWLLSKTAEGKPLITIEPVHEPTETTD